MGIVNMLIPRKWQHPAITGTRLKLFFCIVLIIKISFIVYVYNVASSCSNNNSHINPNNILHQLSSFTAQTESTISFEKKISESSSSHFSQWLIDNADTPGARLVALLKEHLHPHRNAEAERLNACHNKNYALCFAGHAAYEEALSNAPLDKKNNSVYLERTTKMPFASFTFEGEDGYSVWRMRRFSKIDGKLRVIHNLGTEPSCIALLLAGAAVKDFGIVLELGTYLGLSSKCIGLGLNSTDRSDAYYAFDLFGNDDFNYEKITHQMPWTLEAMPDFKKESSYQWLWRNATNDVYPTARAFEGFINSTTLYPKLWRKQPVALMSVDSAKSWGAFRDQTAGIQRPYMLKKGSILILMDFLTIDTQIKLLYSGCLSNYLQPVYSSFCRGEQWIFVATQSFSLGMIGACMQDFLGDHNKGPTEQQYDEMIRMAERHVNLLDTLNFESKNDGDSLSPIHESERICMMEHLTKELKESPKHWSYLRVQ